MRWTSRISKKLKSSVVRDRLCMVPTPWAALINIMTKKPDEGIKTSAKIGYGDMNTWLGSAANSGGFGQIRLLRFRKLFKKRRVHRCCRRKNENPTTPEKEVERYNFSGKLYYDPDDTSSLSLSFAHYDQEDTGRYKIPGYEVNSDSDRYGLSYQKNGDGWNLSGTAYRNEFYGDYTSPYYDSATQTYNAINYISANDQNHPWSDLARKPESL